MTKTATAAMMMMTADVGAGRIAPPLGVNASSAAGRALQRAARTKTAVAPGIAAVKTGEAAATTAMAGTDAVGPPAPLTLARLIGTKSNAFLTVLSFRPPAGVAVVALKIVARARRARAD